MPSFKKEKKWGWRKQQNESFVLEGLGAYKCDAGMSVKNVPAVVYIQTLKGRFSAHKYTSQTRIAGLKN